MKEDSVKLPFISKTDNNMFLSTQMRTVSNCPVVTAATHGKSIRGAFHQIINAIQVYLQILSSWLLFGIKRTLWLLSALCLRWIPQQTSPHANRWPVHSPWRLQKQTKVEIDFLWPCYLYLAVSYCNYCFTNPIHHMAREGNCDSHTTGELWAAITQSSYLEKAQKASLLLSVSPLTHRWNPHSISLFHLLSLSASH